MSAAPANFRKGFPGASQTQKASMRSGSAQHPLKKRDPRFDDSSKQGGTVQRLMSPHHPNNSNVVNNLS